MTEPISKDFRVWMTEEGEMPYAASVENYEYHADFKVYRVWQVLEPWDGVGFQRKGSDIEPDFVQLVEEAEVFLSGFVKWDGCSNWDFGEGSIHFCDVDSAAEIGELFRKLYAWAKELGQDRLD